jgi:hypothetical protein
VEVEEELTELHAGALAGEDEEMRVEMNSASAALRAPGWYTSWVLPTAMLRIGILPFSLPASRSIAHSRLTTVLCSAHRWW